MKTIILAGGLPSTLEEGDEKLPKPMATIGDRPILWHIMKLFSHYGYDDFIICAGFRSDAIKEYFLNYYVYSSDITVHLATNEVEIHHKVTEPWRVAIIDTGLASSTAERLYRVSPLVDGDCFVVYGDCVSDLDVPALATSHKKAGKPMTAVLAKPGGRNRIVPLDAQGGLTASGQGQSPAADAWANACVMAVAPAILKQPPQSGERFEVDTLERLAAQGQVNTYRHEGFWLPVETMRDKKQLQAMWDAGNPPWRLWED